jgi:pectate lyase
MFDDPQLDVDEAPKGAQYKMGDMVITQENELMVVIDIEIEYMDDRDDPRNYDYLLMDKECNEYWYSHAQIEHKANHMKEVYHG